MQHTLKGLYSLVLCCLLPDASKHRLQQLSGMRLDLFVGIARHENVCVRSEAFSATFRGATLQVGDLLDAHTELRLPLFFRDMDIFAVQYLVNRVGAAVEVLARRSHCG